LAKVHSRFSARLQGGDPPVHLSERFASRNMLIVDPQALQPEDDEVVVDAIRSVLTGPPARVFKAGAR
jgi:hypothetical protein